MLLLSLNSSEHAVREIIKREIEGPSSLLGYRRMWNKLRTSYNVTVPQHMVMRILRELDPDASALRRLGSCDVDHTS